MEPLPDLPGVQGLVVSVFSTLLTMGASSYFIIKKYRSDFKETTEKTDAKAEDAAKEAEKRVMDAMQTELGIVRSSLSEVRKDNTRLNHVINTIYAALKSRGIYITVDGD